MSKKKPTFKYTFLTEDNAAEFLQYANDHYHSSFAQHPVTDNVPDLLSVLVTGSASTNYDLILRNDLDNKAKELKGEYVPLIR